MGLVSHGVAARVVGPAKGALGMRTIVSILALAMLAVPARGADEPATPKMSSQSLRDWAHYNNAGWLALNSGNLKRAEQCFGLAIKTALPYQGNDPRLLARNYYDLARVLYLQRRPAEAQPLAEWSLKARESHPKVAPAELFQTVFLLGAIHRAQNHFGEAESCFRKALDIQAKKIGGEHAHLADTYDALGNVLRDQSRYKEAEAYYKKSLALLEKQEPDFNLNLADTAEHYAVLLRKTLREDDAKAQEGRAAAIRDRMAGAEKARSDAKDAQAFRAFREPASVAPASADPKPTTREKSVEGNATGLPPG